MNSYIWNVKMLFTIFISKLSDMLKVNKINLIIRYVEEDFIFLDHQNHNSIAEAFCWIYFKEKANEEINYN